MEYKINSKTFSKFFAFLVSSIIILLIIFSGPANAYSLKVDSNKNTVEQGKQVTFNVKLKINSNEDISDNKIVFEINGNKTVLCEFNLNGEILSGCEGMDIKKIANKIKDKDDEKGYGYGKDKTNIIYKIKLDTANYSAGKYDAQLSLKINNENIVKSAGNFIIIPSHKKEKDQKESEKDKKEKEEKDDKNKTKDNSEKDKDDDKSNVNKEKDSNKNKENSQENKNTDKGSDNKASKNQESGNKGKK